MVIILAPGAPLMLSQFVFTVLGVTLRFHFWGDMLKLMGKGWIRFNQAPEIKF